MPRRPGGFRCEEESPSLFPHALHGGRELGQVKTAKGRPSTSSRGNAAQPEPEETVVRATPQFRTASKRKTLPATGVLRGQVVSKGSFEGRLGERRHCSAGVGDPEEPGVTARRWNGGGPGDGRSLLSAARGHSDAADGATVCEVAPH